MSIEQKAEAFNKIRELMGYVEDGSDVVVSIYQDDATKTFHVRVGSDSVHWGETLTEAINEAHSCLENLNVQS